MTGFRDAERRLWESLGATPVEHRVPLRQLGSTVRVLEVGAGPPVLFVHGTSVAASTWATLAARLQDFRCLLLDRPGCGLSEPLPERLDVDRMPVVADTMLAEVLDGLGLASARLVATSRGGYDAIRTTAAHRDRVERLLLFGWCMGTPEASAPWWLRLNALPGTARMMGVVKPTRGAVRAMLRQFGLARAVDEGRLSDEAVEWLVALYRETDTMRHEATGAPGLLSLRRGWDDRIVHDDALLASMTTPTCLVWGEDDPFGDADAARGLARRIPGADLHLLPRTGHAPWLDEPDTCTELTRDFLAD